MQRPCLVASLILVSACAQAPTMPSSAGQSSAAPPAADLSLWRLDCGTSAQPNDLARWSDTFAYRDVKMLFTYSCYVIKHGDDYMVWDTGFPPGANPNAPKVSLGEQLGHPCR